MAKKAPGKHYREGLSLVQLTRMFPDDKAAEKWFVENRWPDGAVAHAAAPGTSRSALHASRSPTVVVTAARTSRSRPGRLCTARSWAYRLGSSRSTC